ncbi:hypothetical protein AURDEDRAFT_176115 [Auricularia subglabra TFB-10046 SS5]|uniref:Uncharacterized protein n=1 Tax=Auricularia subglabra (strain TFB-10046 / SS5) TaxID=717982 RepID=J0WRZ8_AURST|nr:hypothetical protein AURDEDRAFT_176115 [Auricularia subglabra TFB-10046 SS5]
MDSSRRFLSPFDPDDNRPMDPDLLNLPWLNYTVSYSTDIEAAEIITMPDEKYETFKSGRQKHLLLLHERNELRVENFTLKQMITGVRHSVKRANEQHASLEEDFNRIKAEIVAARRDAHLRDQRAGHRAAMERAKR